MHRLSCSLFALSLSIWPAAPAQSKHDEPAPTIEERIEMYLSTGGHADHVGPDFEANLVRDLKSIRPEDLDQLESAISTVSEYVRQSEVARARHCNAVRLYALAAEAGKSTAASQLRTTMTDYPLGLSTEAGWSSTEEGRFQEELHQALYDLRRTVLMALGEVTDDRILTEALRLVAKGDPPSRNDAVKHYLEPLLRENRAARIRVKKAVENKKSDVYRNETLDKLIAKLDQEDAQH